MRTEYKEAIVSTALIVSVLAFYFCLTYVAVHFVLKYW
jgi:hypothetical protein